MDASAARCANHPAAAASFACRRCGTFSCEGCTSAGSPGLCFTCASRTNHALNVGDIIQNGVRLLLDHPRALGLLIASQVLFGLVTIPLMRPLLMAQQNPSPQDPFGPLLDMIPSWAALTVSGMLVASVTNALLLRFFGDVVDERRRSPGEFLQVALARVPAMVLVTLLVAVVLGFGLVACIIPGLFFAVTFAIATPAVVLKPAGPLEALSLSWRQTEGQRWNVALVLLIAALVIGAASMVSAMISPFLPKLGTTGMVVYTLVTYSVAAVGAGFYQALLVLLYTRLEQRSAVAVA